MAKEARDPRRAAGFAELERGDVGTWAFDPRPDADGWIDLERVRHPQGLGLERIRVRVLPDEAGRLELRELHFLDLGESITAKRLRALRLGALELMVTMPVEPSGASKLKPPAGRGYPEEFYERVAAAYRVAARKTGRPVRDIAAEAGVPRSTAARWVKEARRRDKLGPAPAGGKAGG